MGAHLPQSKGDEANDPAEKQEEAPRAREGAEPDHERHQPSAVDHQGAGSVETRALWLDLLLLHTPEGEAQDHDAQGHVREEEASPAQVLREDPAEEGPEGKAGVDRGNVPP